MLRVLSVLFLAFLFSFPASSHSNPPPSSIVNLRAELLQQQINQLQTDVKVAQNNPADHDNLVTLIKGLTDLEKRVEDIHQYVAYLGWFQQQINQLQTDVKVAQNNPADHDNLVTLIKGLRDLEKRVDDIHQYVAYWGWFSGGAFAVITLLFVYVSFRTLALAKGEAKKAIKKFVSNTVDEVSHAIDEKSKETFKAIAEQAALQLTAHKMEYQTLLDRMNPSPSDKGKTLDLKDVPDLHRLTEQLRQKPEDQYSFDDWRVRYLEAANRKALDEVSKYVEGMEHSVTDDWQNATATVGRAWLLTQRQQYAEAIKLTDRVVDQYGTSEDLRLIERVATALLIKGYSLGGQGQWGATLAVYDDLVLRYGARSEAGIAKQVAGALFNRAVALDELKRTSEAKVTYTTLIERYGSRIESEILAVVEKAKKELKRLNNV